MSLVGKNIVVIGGGNGTATIMSSLSDSGAKLTALLSMADDGGSTGRLRKELGVSAVGDIRQCLAALCKQESSQDLFSYRFGEGNLEGHSFGNIFLTSAEQKTGSLYKAIDIAKNILNVQDEILPITDDEPYLYANVGGKEIEGVYNIAQQKLDLVSAELNLRPKSKIADQAKESILKADLVVIAPGNFYCSVLPALIVEGVYETLKKSLAKKVMFTNLVNFKNHCDGFKISDYISETDRLVGKNFLDIIIANNEIDKTMNEQFVLADTENVKSIETINEALLSPEKIQPDPNDKIAQVRSNVRHDKTKLHTIITQILRS